MNYLINTTKMQLRGVYDDFYKALDAIPSDQDNYYLADSARAIAQGQAFSDAEMIALGAQMKLEFSDSVKKSRMVIAERLHAAWLDLPVNVRLRKGRDF